MFNLSFNSLSYQNNCKKNHILYFLNTCASIVSTLDISICHIVARKWAIFKLLDQSTPTYQVVPKWKDYKLLDQNLHPFAIAKLLYGGCTFLFYLRHEPPKRKRLCRRILDQPATYRKRPFSHMAAGITKHKSTRGTWAYRLLRRRRHASSRPERGGAPVSSLRRCVLVRYICQ